jgi:hypothetical protein
MINREDAEWMMVGDSPTECSEKRLVLFVNSDGSCLAVDIGFQTNFLEGRPFETFAWPNCKPIPERELMTTEECVGWAYNEGAVGWQVRPSKHFSWNLRVWNYSSPEDYERRRVFPDGTFGEPEPMWKSE